MNLSDFLPKIQFPSQLVSKHRPGASIDSKIKRILSAQEVGDRIEKGLCFFRDELFTLEHTHKNLRYIVVEKDEDEPEQVEYKNQQLGLSTSTASTATAIQTPTTDPAQIPFLCCSAPTSMFIAPEPVGTLKGTPIPERFIAPNETLFPSDSTPSFSDPFSFERPEKHDEAQGSAGDSNRPSNGNMQIPISTPNHRLTLVSEVGVTRLDGSMDKEVDRVFSPKPSAPNQNRLTTQKIALPEQNEDDTKKTQGEDQTVTDPVSDTSFDPKTQVHRSAPPPPTRTSFSVATVSVINIRPFDPGSIELRFSNRLSHEGNSPITNRTLAAWKHALDSRHSENRRLAPASVSILGISPLSLLTFLNKNSRISGVVLEDYESVFGNNSHHSQLDDLSIVSPVAIVAAASLVTISFIHVLKLLNLLPMFMILTNEEGIVFMMMMDHYQFYNLKCIILGVVLAGSWLNAIGQYKGVFYKRDILSLGHFVTIRGSVEADSHSQFKSQIDASTVSPKYANIPLMSLCLYQACHYQLLIKDYDFVWENSVEMAKMFLRKMLVNILNCLETTLAICCVCCDPPEDIVNMMCDHVLCYQSLSEYLAVGYSDESYIIWSFLVIGIAKEFRDNEGSFPITSADWLIKCCAGVRVTAAKKSLSLWNVYLVRRIKRGAANNACDIGEVLEQFSIFVKLAFDDNILLIYSSVGFCKRLDGVLVHAGLGDRLQGKIITTINARGNRISFLRICPGMPLVDIKYAQVVLGVKDANNIEIDPNARIMTWKFFARITIFVALYNVPGQLTCNSSHAKCATPVHGQDADHVEYRIMLHPALGAFTLLHESNALYEGITFFKLQGASFITLIAYHPDCLCTSTVYASAQRFQLACEGGKYVAVLHRKMIPRGNVQAAKILLKWKALPLKHGTWKCSSLRTRMFEGTGYCYRIFHLCSY